MMMADSAQTDVAHSFLMLLLVFLQHDSILSLWFYAYIQITEASLHGAHSEPVFHGSLGFCGGPAGVPPETVTETPPPFPGICGTLELSYMLLSLSKTGWLNVFFC